LEAEIAQLKTENQLQESNITALWNSVSDLANAVIILQNEVDLINATISPGGNNSLTLAYNQTECLARGAFTTAFQPVAGQRGWYEIYADPFTGPAACKQSSGSPTCEVMCASYGLKCDPCGMLQMSCQTNLYQALVWAGVPEAQLKDRFRVFDGQSSFTGPCPSTQNPTAGGPYGSEANLNNRLLGANTVFCQGDFITGLWPFVKNFATPSQTTYIDPVKACSMPPVVYGQSGTTYGVVCPCAKPSP
jgi:hypothetical protein